MEELQPHAPFGACTIVSKNYLAHARVLSESFLTQHPTARFFVLLVDEPDLEWNRSEEIFETILLSELGIRDMETMCFQYTIKELNTAVKPFLLAHILWNEDIEKLLYLDPDILVLASLEPLWRELASANAVLTPHILHPIGDGIHPGETDVMRVGTYNLGCIGVRRSETSKNFLRWWGERLREHCIEDVPRGLFVDQKWIDLACGLFEGFSICRDPGANVAYWNLHERPIESRDGAYTVRGMPLLFFHFSGFRPERPRSLTLYASSHTVGEQPAVQELCHTYASLLEQHGYGEMKNLPYAFGAFSNGVPIPRIARMCFRTLGEDRKRFGNPFSAGIGSFFEWLQEPHIALGRRAFLTNMHRSLHDHIAHVSAIFPRLTHNPTARSYAWWLLHPLQRTTFDMDETFFESLLPLAKPRRILHRLCPAIACKIVRGTRWTLGEYDRRIRLRIAQWSMLLVRGMRRATEPRLNASNRARGVNVMGYFGASSGVGIAARLHATALEAVGIPIVRNATTIDALTGGCVRHHPYATNIIHVNADQVPMALAYWGREYFAGKRNIGTWVWELSHFPQQWMRHARHFSELWVPSSFVAESLRTISPIPVHVVPHPVSLPERRSHALNRPHFRLPTEAFLFCFMFDFLSVFERKNPLATIAAFRMAFGPEEPVGLVVKNINSESNPLGWNRLAISAEDPRIHLIDHTYAHDETIDLLRSCDAYVSLHRSEGFGLTIAEAMALGKPVIATDYGGSTDFLDVETGFPVRYVLRELTEDFGPYARGNIWAEPDIEDAAKRMRFVYENRAEAAKRGAEAAKRMRDGFSLHAIGTIMRNRLFSQRNSLHPETRENPILLPKQCSDPRTENASMEHLRKAASAKDSRADA